MSPAGCKSIGTFGKIVATDSDPANWDIKFEDVAGNPVPLPLTSLDDIIADQFIVRMVNGPGYAFMELVEPWYRPPDRPPQKRHRLAAW